MDSPFEDLKQRSFKLMKPSTIEGNLRPQASSKLKKDKTHQKIKDLMKDKHRSVYHKSVFSLGDLASASCDHKPSKDEPAMCRICQSTDDSLSNQLVTPCCCSGSLQYVHMQCLKQWRQTKKLTGADVSCCELCKQSYNVQLLGTSDVPIDKLMKMQEDLKQLVKSSIYLMLLMRSWKNDMNRAQLPASSSASGMSFPAPTCTPATAPFQRTPHFSGPVVENKTRSSSDSGTDGENEEYVTRQSLKKRSDKYRRKQRQ